MALRKVLKPSTVFSVSYLWRTMSVHSYLLTEEVIKLWHKLLENGVTYVGSISLTFSAV